MNNKDYGLGIVIQEFNPNNVNKIIGETLKFKSKNERDLLKSKIEEMIKPFIVRL